MILEHNYCTREQAEKIKSFGVLNEIQVDDPKGSTDEHGNLFKVPNVGIFYSVKIRDKVVTAIQGDQEDAPYEMYNPIKHYSCSELGFILPIIIEMKHNGANRQWELFCGKDDDGFFTGYFNASIGTSGKFICQNYRDVEAESRAAMVIYLLEKKLLVADDINECLLSLRPKIEPNPAADKKDDLSGDWDF